MSVGNSTYNLTKYDKIQITDITEIRYPSSGASLLQKWKNRNNNVNGDMKIGKFSKSTKTSSPTPDSGATGLPQIGNSFMFVESSSNNHGNYTYVTWERTDIVQISNIEIYYNRFSITTDDNLKAMGRFSIQLLLEDETWSTEYIIQKNTQNSATSTEWMFLNLNITKENFGVRFVYDKIYTAHADMRFSKIIITHSV